MSSLTHLIIKNWLSRAFLFVGVQLLKKQVHYLQLIFPLFRAFEVDIKNRVYLCFLFLFKMGIPTAIKPFWVSLCYFAVNVGYASLYGQLPEFDLKKNQKVASEAVIVPSERPWETIFSGSSHNLPPLTKLCGAFLESLLEKRPAAVEKS